MIFQMLISSPNLNINLKIIDGELILNFILKKNEKNIYTSNLIELIIKKNRNKFE